MEQRYGNHTMRPPIPPVPPIRVSSLNSSSRTMSSNGGRSSENSSLRSGRSALSMESSNRTSQESAKPRLSKDQQEFLERRFAEQPKPNTQTKKSFAAELNVPLEKINNWFQNRRAKSKQDARKKQGPYAQYLPAHPFAPGPHAFEPSYIDQSFYHTSHPHHAYGWQQPVLPGHSTDLAMNPANTQFNFELDPSNCIPTHGLPADHMMNSTLLSDDSNPNGFEAFFGLSNPSHPSDSYAMNVYRGQFCQPDGFGSAMDTIPEYDIPDSSTSASQYHSLNPEDTLSRQNTVSSEELSNSIPYPPRNGDLPMAPSADFFHPHDMQGDLYALPTWGQSAGHPIDLGDTHMQEMSLPQTESELPYRTVGPTYFTEPPTSTLYQSSAASGSGTFLDRLQHRDTSAQDDTDDADQTSLKASHNSSVPSDDIGQRRDSTMTRLVESIDNVHVQPHTLEKRPSQQSIGHPSLASRRQRRPAPLGSSSTRSTSFSSNAPASPKPLQSHSSQRELRRIKSSIGTVNGRVHKSNLSGAAQKSPLSFTFSDAANSARASKSLSSRSMTSLSIDTVSRSNSLVPATPISPPADDLAHIQFVGLDNAQPLFAQHPSTKDESVWANMPNTSDTTTDSVWSSFVPQNPDSWINFSSPPDTPLQQHQSTEAPAYDQEAAQTQLGGSWPQSMQTANSNVSRSVHSSQGGSEHFSHLGLRHDRDDVPTQTMQRPGQASSQLLEEQDRSHLHKASKASQVMAENHAHRSLEQPTNTALEQQPQSQHHSPTRGQTARSEAASVTPQPAPQSLPVAQRGSQSRQAGLNMFHVSDPNLRNLEPGQVPTSLMQPTTTPPRATQALMIHQYSPSDPVPTERMPPRTHSSDVPKNLTFQMCGPESFSSP